MPKANKPTIKENPRQRTIASFFARPVSTQPGTRTNPVDETGNEAKTLKRARVADDEIDGEEIEFLGIKKRAVREESIAQPREPLMDKCVNTDSIEITSTYQSEHSQELHKVESASGDAVDAVESKSVDMTGDNGTENEDLDIADLMGVLGNFADMRLLDRSRLPPIDYRRLKKEVELDERMVKDVWSAAETLGGSTTDPDLIGLERRRVKVFEKKAIEWRMKREGFLHPMKVAELGEMDI